MTDYSSFYHFFQCPLHTLYRLSHGFLFIYQDSDVYNFLNFDKILQVPYVRFCFPFIIFIIEFYYFILELLL